MTAFVSEFLLNPVIRQARRFSEISRATLLGDNTGDNDLIAAATAHTRVLVLDSEASPCDRVGNIGNMSLVSPTQVASSGAVSNEPYAITPVSHLLQDPVSSMFPILPDDDGMGVPRRRIQEIYRRDIPQDEKGRLMHEVLMQGYRQFRATLKREQAAQRPQPLPSIVWEELVTLGPLESLKFWPSGTKERLLLTTEDIKPTYSNIDLDGDGHSQVPMRPGLPRLLGCEHYLRNVKLQCSTCAKWYTCRFCHDDVEDHSLVRKDTKNMLCMLCGCPQRVSDVCIKCGEVAARYYCDVCKLWDDHPNKPIYHCVDCGICRRGSGLGKDFFHCKTCCACISIHIESSHKCIERSMDCDCPICGEYLFTSPKPVVFMRCGHSIHVHCYDQYISTSYKCPICNKSLFNMETQCRNLDAAILTQPMPAEFQDTRALVLCNDCSARSSVKYHWLGLKCAICKSYNTVELQTSEAGGLDSNRLAVAALAISSLDQPPSCQMLDGISLLEPSNMRRRLLHHEASCVGGNGTCTGSVTPSAQVSGRTSPIVPDEDSDDDLLGLWPSHIDDGTTGSGGEADDDDEEDEEEDEEGNEEEEADNDILLIGHR